ncbi:MAG: hypothetical protein U0Q16_29595 [Bryobacteraceae bacterium]
MVLAVAAVAAVLLCQALLVRSQFEGHWNALFYTGDYYSVPDDLARSTYVHRGSTGYDAQFYRYLAHDPWISNYSTSYDDARLRCRRILLPALAHALALGRRDWIDAAYIAVVALGLALGVYWSAMHVASFGAAPVWGLLFLAMPGPLTSITRLLLDGLATALFAGFIVAAESGSFASACIVACLAALNRETGLILVAALAGSELLQRRYRQAAIAAASAVPALCWFAYVAARTEPSRAGFVFDRPIYGLALRLLSSLPLHPSSLFDAIARSVDAVSVLGLLATLAFGLFFATTAKRSPVSIAVFLFAALGLMLGHEAHLAEAIGFGRPVSPLFLYVFFQALRDARWPGVFSTLTLAPAVLLSPVYRVSRWLVGLD